MPDVMRVKLRWDGFTGGPGFSVFHFRNLAEAGITQTDAQAAVTKVHTFANTLKGMIPYQSRLTVESDVESYDYTTGRLITVVGVTAPAVITSTVASTVTYSGAAGASITWRTPQVRNGRRIRGRTFLVPLTGVCFTAGGNLDATALANINLGANGLRDDTGVPDLVIWSRPSGPGASDGELAAINGHSVPARGAVLRSRRD